MKKLVFLVLLIPCIAYGQRFGSRKERDVVKEANMILITSTLTDGDIYSRTRQILLSDAVPIASTGFDTGTIDTGLIRIDTNYDMRFRVGIREGVVRITGEALDRFGTAFPATLASESRGGSEAFKRMNYYALVLRDKLESRQIEYRKE